jgi:acyl dehydratase
MTEPVRDKQIHEKPGRYFEDYPVGAVYVGGPITVSEEDILEFARHTGSLVMQLMVKHFVPTPGNLASPGLDELRWLRPVRPGDSLSLRVTIESARLSRSKPGQGVVTGLVEALNQRGETVMSLKPISLMRCRPAS